MRRLRLSVRLRLTALYGALFLVAGAFLLSVNYVLVRANLAPRAVSVPDPDEPFVPVEAPDGRRTIVLEPPDFTQPTSVAQDQLEKISATYRDDALHQLLVQSGAALGVAAIASVVLGWVVAGRVLRPVQDITSAARRLSERNLSERINMGGPQDELRELADTFDAMLGRLDAAFDAQSRFAANASHELRTPLSIMRTELEVARRDPNVTREQLLAMTDKLRLVIDRTERVIDGLLMLARSARRLETREPVDLSDVVEVALAQAEPEVQKSDVEVKADLDPALTEGDGTLLEHLAWNLVANATRYNVRGGWVEVATFEDGDNVVLRVSNTGPPVDSDAAEALFEPFRRGGNDRTSSDRGVGLGLSIVRAVALAHGGAVELRPRSEGGLDVEVTLPRPGEG